MQDTLRPFEKHLREYYFDCLCNITLILPSIDLKCGRKTKKHLILVIWYGHLWSKRLIQTWWRFVVISCWPGRFNKERISKVFLHSMWKYNGSRFGPAATAPLMNVNTYRMSINVHFLICCSLYASAFECSTIVIYTEVSPNSETRFSDEGYLHTFTWLPFLCQCSLSFHTVFRWGMLYILQPFVLFSLKYKAYEPCWWAEKKLRTLSND